ncbi:unnamed protein product, partial [Symbiodinium pilosum]
MEAVVDERVHPTAEDESLELDGPDGGPGGGASEVLPDAGEAEGARSEVEEEEEAQQLPESEAADLVVTGVEVADEVTLKETLSAEAAWPEGLQDEVDLEPSAEQEDEVLPSEGQHLESAAADKEETEDTLPSAAEVDQEDDAVTRQTPPALAEKVGLGLEKCTIEELRDVISGVVKEAMQSWAQAHAADGAAQ